MRSGDLRRHSFLDIAIFMAIMWCVVPTRTAFSHTLPGTYSYLTVHPKKIDYRLIISGVDMCRLTGWQCEDLSPEDLPSLVKIRDELSDKLAAEIRVSQAGRILPLVIREIKALPIGFEVSIECPSSKPIKAFTVSYKLLSNQKETFQSFFSISTYSGPKNWTQFDLLDNKHAALSWDISGKKELHSKTLTRELIFDLRTYVEQDLAWSWLLLGVGVAILLGIGHAFTPGHGKSIMAAYLVGSHGHLRDAIVMGLTTTATHTFSVILLGLVVMFFSQYILPSTLYPLMARLSAVLVIFTGLYVLYRRILEKRHANPKYQDTPHAHTHEHNHHHIHSHRHNHHHHSKETTGQAFWLAFSGGLIPCPSALAVLLAAISIGKVGYGIIMILMFSVGLGATLVVLGIGILTSRSLVNRMDSARKCIKHLDLVGPSFIIIVGILFFIHGPFGSLSSV